MKALKSLLATCLLLASLLPATASAGGGTGPGESGDPGSLWEGWKRAACEGVRDPLVRWHYYWKDGFRIDGEEQKVRFRLNGRLMLDGGYTGTDHDLDTSFPGFEGAHVNLRDLRLSMLLTIYGWVELKLSADFADVRAIKDQWIRLKRLPWGGVITLGHMKEPFSLEQLTSTKYLTFMERSLGTESMAPGRNMGINHTVAMLDRRMTWALGVFLNTGSFSAVGDSFDRITETNGWNITTRLTGLPWYEDGGKRLLLLGLSYTHQFRDMTDAGTVLRTRPESRLTDTRLVDTAEFLTRGMDRIASELALVSGPLSLQGEIFHLFADADGTGDPRFWGFYLYGTWFVTGEHRNYDRSNGVFTRVTPNRKFSFSNGGWGALEAALRFSMVDLNGGTVRGGREYDLTAGMNWYLNDSLRFMFNYVLARAEDRQSPPALDEVNAHIVQARLQMVF